jgi:peptidoglycan/xylan/chitin deacetylase (PgdA/CDA1 family)
MDNSQDILFLLSVDTEEEWDWSGEFPQEDFSVGNVARIKPFHEFCERLGIRPTYFTDYAVAANPEAADVLRTISANRTCEIGAHLHPWCNPPYFGKTTDKESHVVNLPLGQVEQKLDALIELLNKQFGIIPNSFRTGRWGINGDILDLLEKRGFQVDSSMFPFFRNEYFDCEQTPLEPYWPDYDNPMEKGAQRNLIEIPVTVGFNRKNYRFMRSVYNTISHPSLYHLHLVAIFWHTHLLRKLYLCPEVTPNDDMRLLVNSALANEQPVIHMYFHSSSLVDGATGFFFNNNSGNSPLIFTEEDDFSQGFTGDVTSARMQLYMGIMSVNGY